MEARDTPVALGMLMVAVAVFWIVLQFVVTMKTDARCARLGWPESKVTWSFDRYCGKRIQQTDSLLPLRVLEARAEKGV